MAYLYDLTDTWNAAGTVFNAIKMNVTNTASAAGSKIVSLQVGATDRFTVDKDGNGYFSGTLQAVGSITAPNVYIGANSGTIGMQDNSASILAYNATGSGGITNTLRFITGAAERVRIDGSGNVGIGTSSPGAKLETSVTSAGATAEVLRLSNPGAGANTQAQINFSTTSTSYATITGGYGASAPQMTFNLPSVTAGNYVWQISSSEKMRLDSSGNLGIGTATPANRLQVSYTSTAPSLSSDAGAGLSLLGSSTLRVNIGSDPSSPFGGWVQASNGSGSAFPLSLNPLGGSVGIGTSSPISYSGYNTLDIDSATNGGLINIKKAGTTVGYLNGNSGLLLLANSTDLKLSATGANTIQFLTGSTERARITSGGDVLVGKTAASVGTDGVQLLATGYSGFSAAGTTALFLNRNTNDGTILEFGRNGVSAATMGLTSSALTFGTAGSERMRIDTSGNLGLGGTPSAWGTAYKAMQIAGQGVSVFGSTVSSTAGIGSNGYYDGTNWVRNNSDSAGQYQIAGSVHKWYNAAAASSGTTISFTQAMTLDATGSLLVGTTTNTYGYAGSPSIELNGTDAALLALKKGGAAGSYISHNNTLNIFNTTANPIVLATNNTEKMRITSGGNVGIGTSSPGAKLDVNGDAKINGVTVGLGSGGVNSNTALGYLALNSNTTGGSNTSVGWAPLYSNTTGNNNCALGLQALFLSTTGSDNVVLGVYSGYENTTGTGNTYVGNSTGRGISTGNYNTIIGAGVSGLSATLSNNIILADGQGNRRLNIDSSGNVGIGTSSPGAKLHVVGGNIKVDASTRWIGYWEADGLYDGYLAPYNSSGQTELVNSYGSGGILFKTGTAKAERMRIDSSGSLLVGTTTNTYGYAGTPSIELNGTDAALIALKKGGAAGSYISHNNTLNIFNTTSNPIVLATSNTERLRVKSSGGVRYVPLASAPASPEAGEVYYDSSTNKLRCYNGTAWNDLF